MRYATADEVRNISELLASGKTVLQVAQITGRGRSMIEAISAGRHRMRTHTAFCRAADPGRWRCPTCRQMVNTPKCILCEVRAMA